VSWEMQLEAVTEQSWRCALGSHDCANLKAIIVQVWRYGSRLCSTEHADAPGGHNRAGWRHLYIEAMIMHTGTL